MDIKKKLLTYNFVKYVKKISCDTTKYYFISFIDNKNKVEYIQKINNEIKNIKLIFLDFMPIKKNGLIDEDKLFKKISLLTTEDFKKFLLEKNPTLKDVTITKKQYPIPNTLSFYKGSNPKIQTSQPIKTSIPFKLAHVKGKKLTNAHQVLTLIEALSITAYNYPDKGIINIDKAGNSQFLSYKKLLKNSKVIASSLKANGVKPLSNIIICISKNDNYFELLWGCILNKCVPTTVKFTSFSEKSSEYEKFYNTWSLLKKPIILANDSKIINFLHNQIGKESSKFEILSYDKLIKKTFSKDFFFKAINCDMPVFYQLTSGSTGIPKCIIETHRNILEHIINSSDFNKYSNHDISLNWISLDHVVPIITYHFRDVYLGCNQIHVESEYIIEEPTRWLTLIDTYNVSLTWAPNFAYKMLLETIKRIPNQSYKLKSVRYFMNAGEQVTLGVMKEFERFLDTQTLANCLIQPAFGMAEAATCMTYNNHYKTQKPVAIITSNSQANKFISLGKPINNCEIRIVDVNRHTLAEKIIGILEIKGTVLSNGYFNNKNANSVFYDDGWFSTGDLGFIYNQELYIVGREKETIIIRGQNYYCYEIEDIIEKVQGVKPTFSAAISVFNEHLESEELIIFYVIDENSSIEYKNIETNIKKSISENYKIQPSYIIPIPHYDFPKTSSGKIQRNKIKLKFINGEYSHYLTKQDDIIVLHQKIWIPKQIEKINSSCDLNTIIFTDGIKNLNYINKFQYNDLKVIKKIINYRNIVITYFLTTLDNHADKLCWLKNFLIKISKGNSRIENIIILTHNLFKISILDNNHGYYNGWLIGFVKSIQKELVLPKIIIIDVDNMKYINNFVAQEINAGLKENLVCYRKNKRFILRLSQHTFPNKFPIIAKRKLPLNKYILIIGGTGGIGKVIAEYLHNNYKIPVIITGTKKEIEKKDYYHYIQLNLSLSNNLDEKFKEYSKKISHVLYLPGIMNKAKVTDINKNSISKILNIKNKNIEDIVKYFFIKNKKIKFFIFSSITSILGSAEFSLYAASNSLSESVTEYLSRKYRAKLYYISWCPWDNIGMAKAINYRIIQNNLSYQILTKQDALNILYKLLNIHCFNTYVGFKNKDLISEGLYNGNFDEYFKINVNNSRGFSAKAAASIFNTQFLDHVNKIAKIKIITDNITIHDMNTKSLIEEKLQKLWMDSLKLSGFDKKASFFELGGDSLLAIQLLMNINSTFKTLIDMEDLIKENSFYNILKKLEKIKSKQLILDKTDQDIKIPHLLSSNQQRILYQCQLGDNKSYSIYKVYKINKKINLKKFKDCVDKMLKIFPALSATLKVVDGEFYQLISNFSINDVFFIKELKNNRQIILEIKKFISKEFNLFGNEPLLKISVLLENKNNFYMLFKIHHIICDEWSLKLFFKTLSALYFSDTLNLSLSYNDKQMLSEQIFQENHHDSKKYSTTYLKNIASAANVFDLDSIINTTGSFVYKKINYETYENIKNMAANSAMTIASLFHAVFHLTLHKFFNKEKLNTATPITMRNDYKLRNSFGFFTNTTIVNSTYKSAEDSFQFFDRFKKTYNQIYLNRNIPFSELIKQLRTINNNFNVEFMFVYEDYINDWIPNHNIIKELLVHNNTSKFPLTCIIRYLTSKDIFILIEYNNQLISKKEITALLKCYDNSIKNFIIN